MRKTLIFLGMLAVGYANAQQGKVGVNTENAQATLEVKPTVANAQATATTNEGIIAPRLSKARVANTEAPVEGTLVYVSDIAYTGDDAKVAKITEKGYYYYNGTEWVKTSGANGNIYTTNGKIIEDRTITFEQNGRLNLLGTANIGKNAEALGIVGQDHTYFGFYPQGLNEGRKAFMGFPTTGNKNLTIANENEGGRIILRNATQVGENAESLRIVGQDHTYFGFYPQGVNEGRKAFMGFNTTGAKDLTIQNENENGKILLKNATQVTGTLTASSLSGTGDRPVVAAEDGTLKIGSVGTQGPAGPTGVVSASRGLIYDANTKDISLPSGNGVGDILTWDGMKWVSVGAGSRYVPPIRSKTIESGVAICTAEMVGAEYIVNTGEKNVICSVENALSENPKYYWIYTPNYGSTLDNRSSGSELYLQRDNAIMHKIINISTSGYWCETVATCNSRHQIINIKKLTLVN